MTNAQSAIAVQTHSDGVLVVDSRLIAEQLGIEHRSFLQTIDDYETQIEQAFGFLRFENAEIQGRGRPGRYVLLTEAQSTFVMTLSRNTKEVIKCKLGLVQAFERAKAVLASGDYTAQSAIDREIRMKELDIQHDAIKLEMEKVKLKR